jgi:predicted cobalt transporter CbtA
MIAKRILSTAALGACALLALMGTARASSLVLTCQAQAPGTDSTCPATAPMYSVPGLYLYGDSITSPDGTGTISGSDIDGNSAGFIDAYFFDIAPAKADAVSATITDGSTISAEDLFARLYTLSSNPAGLVTGTPFGTVYNGVISTSDGSTTVTIGQIMLPAGSYVLEISGTINGSFAGGYTGSLDLAPVPLPASFPLLLAGLLGFAGLFIQKSRNR